MKYGSQYFDSAVLWLVGCVALGKSFFFKPLDPMADTHVSTFPTGKTVLFKFLGRA